MKSSEVYGKILRNRDSFQTPKLVMCFFAHSLKRNTPKSIALEAPNKCGTP